jgi:ATP-dependent exoDNAse (exonuclease V) alpha subunit
LQGFCRGLGPQEATVVLFDEPAMAPTRLSAVLFAHAECARAKVIAAGDAGQLPSVQAGGWFGAITGELGGPELRAGMRQRNAEERAALEALHDGDAGAYIEFKRAQGALDVHARESEALAKLLDEWDAARVQHGLSAAVMIAPDNTTRARLNQEARRRLIEEGWLAEHPVTIGGGEFRVGERVIARRNDRFRDIDNGTWAGG